MRASGVQCRRGEVGQKSNKDCTVTRVVRRQLLQFAIQILEVCAKVERLVTVKMVDSVLQSDVSWSERKAYVTNQASSNKP